MREAETHKIVQLSMLAANVFLDFIYISHSVPPFIVKCDSHLTLGWMHGVGCEVVTTRSGVTHFEELPRSPHFEAVVMRASRKGDVR